MTENITRDTKVYLIIEIHGVRHVVSQFGRIEGIVARHLVLSVEVTRLLAGLVYHIVVDVRVVR